MLSISQMSARLPEARIISGGTKYIADYAFRSCSNITEIIFPDSVEQLGYLSYCVSLVSVTLPAGMEKIDNYVFDGCRKLTNIKLPDGLKVIGEYAFRNCKALSDIEFPSGLEIIGNGAFSGCNALKNVTLPEGLLRRAARHGKLLGIEGSFLTKLCDVAIGESGGAYPELCEKQEYIKKIISLEEERFETTIDAGLNILSGFIAEAKAEGKSVLSGDDAFKLYDTFGFPIDLTAEIAEENGLKIDEERFTALMKEQKERARAARADLSSWDSAKNEFMSSLEKTEFTGYAETVTEGCKVLAIVVDGETVDSVNEGEFSLILDKTPFYGEQYEICFFENGSAMIYSGLAGILQSDRAYYQVKAEVSLEDMCKAVRENGEEVALEEDNKMPSAE